MIPTYCRNDIEPWLQICPRQFQAVLVEPLEATRGTRVEKHCFREKSRVNFISSCFRLPRGKEFVSTATRSYLFFARPVNDMTRCTVTQTIKLKARFYWNETLEHQSTVNYTISSLKAVIHIWKKNDEKRSSNSEAFLSGWWRDRPPSEQGVEQPHSWS